jgi:hypothetical protein
VVVAVVVVWLWGGESVVALLCAPCQVSTGTGMGCVCHPVRGEVNATVARLGRCYHAETSIVAGGCGGGGGRVVGVRGADHVSRPTAISLVILRGRCAVYLFLNCCRIVNAGPDIGVCNTVNLYHAGPVSVEFC